MPSLKHVCMWTKTGWKPVTIEEISKLHPRGTVSATCGLFMCELCGQFVTLADGEIKGKYFKHSSAEKSKDCPDRTFGKNDLTSYPSNAHDSNAHDLPIKITNISSSSFEFEIGFIPVPKELIYDDFLLEIKPFGYKFTQERFSCDHISYLPVGENPCKEFIISLQNGNNKLYEFWPEHISGIKPSGTLFEKRSGKKLVDDADVKTNNEYYLLTINEIALRKEYYLNRIVINLVCQKQYENKIWHLYVIKAEDFNAEAAKFFLNFHCRLTDNPVFIQPIWPLFVESEYLVKHNEDCMYLVIRGNVNRPKTFPHAEICPLEDEDSTVSIYKVICSDRQQLISVGRSNVLEYAYFWKEPLNQLATYPKISVTDISGIEIQQGESNSLPRNQTLLFRSNFDSELKILKNSYTVEKIIISADKYFTLDKIKFGLTIKLLIGLDVVWQITFKNVKHLPIAKENYLLKKITNVSGATIPVPHSLRNMLIGMYNYPQISQWIRTIIKQGNIKEQSYCRLQDVYLHLKDQ